MLNLKLVSDDRFFQLNLSIDIITSGYGTRASPVISGLGWTAAFWQDCPAPERQPAGSNKKDSAIGIGNRGTTFSSRSQWDTPHGCGRIAARPGRGTSATGRSAS